MELRDQLDVPAATPACKETSMPIEKDSGWALLGFDIMEKKQYVPQITRSSSP
jgi:hypothetical protein